MAISIIGWLLFWQHGDGVRVRIGTARMQVEVADTDVARNKGLAGREQLADNRGMLFVFETDQKWPIWMKDMKIPIDIVWLDANKKVVGVEENVRPDTYPAYFEPPHAARYVLETAAGTARKAKIEPGQHAEFSVPASTR